MTKTASKDFIDNFNQFVPSLSFEQLESSVTGLLVVFVDSSNYKAKIADCDSKYGTMLAAGAKFSEFSGKSGEFARAYAPMSSDLSKVLLVSIGKKETYTDKVLMRKSAHKFGALISDSVNTKNIGAEMINIVFDSSLVGKATEFFAELLFAIACKNYTFSKYFSKRKSSHERYLKGVAFLLSKADDSDATRKSLEELGSAKLKMASNVLLARELVNSPPTDLNPEFYAELIDDTLSDAHGLSVKVLGESEMESLGMNALLAVGRSSTVESKTVIMEYKGNPSSNEYELALVGKGVCFDSGGLSIKPAKGMEDMKIDMGGSAVVFASMKLLSELKPNINVVGVVGLVENMIAGNSYKPGDVLKSMSGQTIEVLNTDAEGRLVLADCLYYAQSKYSVKRMVDFATLTGAVHVALANVHAGFMTNSDELFELANTASAESRDTIWRLPLGPEYDKMINSNVADMKNIGSGGAGTITAAQFLKRFVNADKDMKPIDWAHVDIASVAYTDKSAGSVISNRGATGWGVYFVNELVNQILK